MRARTGFILFIAVFIIMAIVVPLLEGMFRFMLMTLKPAIRIAEECVRTARVATHKIRTIEWKNLVQKTS